jgi:hypothetical protein
MLTTCPHCSAPLREAARFCPSCGGALETRPTGEPEFRRWRRRYFRRLTVFCAIAIPVGLLFVTTSPPTTIIVSGLGLFGLTVGLIRLSTLRASTRR